MIRQKMHIYNLHQIQWFTSATYHVSTRQVLLCSRFYHHHVHL